ncbi:MAG: dienelactone hydrolase family protein [Acidimicrobiales bacterium]
MGMMIELTASDGHVLDAYVAGDPGAASSVVIIQEIFGVNGHIRSVVDRYAEMGHLAIAPAMFDRAQRDLDLEYTPEGMTEGKAVQANVPWDTTTVDTGAAVEHVRRGQPVAVVGYCFGGGVAWRAANELDIDAAVGYYGGQIVHDLDRPPKCPIMLHFGADDPMIPPENIEAIGAAFPAVPIHVYEDAGHGFNCDVRGSYSPEASALAQERTNAFLASNL